MKFCNFEIDVKNKPELDLDFFPIHKFNEAFLRTADKEVSLAIGMDSRRS